MVRYRKILVFDPDSSRRAAMATGLRGLGVHGDPFETIEELADHWPSEGLVLVHDEPKLLESLWQEMTRNGRWLPVAVYGQSPTTSRVVRVVAEGALGYLEMPIDFENVTQHIDEIADLAERRAASMGLGLKAQFLLSRLSTRESEVLERITDGARSKEIARDLGISPRTVDDHRAKLLGKLEVERTAEAIRIALAANLVLRPFSGIV